MVCKEISPSHLVVMLLGSSGQPLLRCSLGPALNMSVMLLLSLFVSGQASNTFKGTFLKLIVKNKQ